jgi:hypothetical protein
MVLLLVIEDLIFTFDFSFLTKEAKLLRRTRERGRRQTTDHGRLLRRTLYDERGRRPKKQEVEKVFLPKTVFPRNEETKHGERKTTDYCNDERENEEDDRRRTTDDCYDERRTLYDERGRRPTEQEVEKVFLPKTVFPRNEETKHGERKNTDDCNGERENEEDDRRTTNEIRRVKDDEEKNDGRLLNNQLYLPITYRRLFSK